MFLEEVDALQDLLELFREKQEAKDSYNGIWQLTFINGLQNNSFVDRWVYNFILKGVIGSEK